MSLALVNQPDPDPVHPISHSLWADLVKHLEEERDEQERNGFMWAAGCAQALIVRLGGES